MHTSIERRRGQHGPRRRAFTLVELLVVIGIIAVLISILLPTLRGARRQANLVQCSSNMKQVSMALIMYVQDNKGRHPPSGAPVISGVYPHGWWFANELVRLGYIKTPGINVYKKPGSNPATDKKYNRANPFRCPEGTDEDYSQNPGFAWGDYPTHAENNGFALLNDGDCAADGFGIPSWYMLNSRVYNGVGAMKLPGGSQATPFVWFNSSTTAATLAEAGAQRHWGQVKRGAELIMLVEASNPNWYDQNSSTKYPGLYLKRLAARHGRVTANGANAFTNLAFFDGHVGLFPTVNFNKGPAGTNEKWPANKFYSETIFWVGNQKGK